LYTVNHLEICTEDSKVCITSYIEIIDGKIGKNSNLIVAFSRKFSKKELKDQV